VNEEEKRGRSAVAGRKKVRSQGSMENRKGGAGG